MNKLNIILSGIVRNNPTFVLVLGMCPTLGTTTSAGNGMGMGLATMAVLIMSNLVISLIKNIIPDKVRIPAFIVVIASFVTVVEMLMKAYTPPLYEALGVFIPLIVVNCIILGRRGFRLEEYAAGFGARRCRDRFGLYAFPDGRRCRARDPGQRRDLRHQPRNGRLHAADLRPRTGGIPGAGVPHGIV